MDKIKGRYIFNEGSWEVRYKVEDADEQHYEQVMLHPNQYKHASQNRLDWFIIKDCPNLHNGGEFEPMAIVVVSDKVEEVAEKLKGKELFKGLNDHARSALQDIDGIPDPDNTPLIKTLNFSDQAILSNAIKFTFGRVTEKGSLSADEFTKTKMTFMHVARWIKDNWKEVDGDFLSAQESKL